jgi:F0F1-type ATP synthase membrane subunit b/b'
MDANLEWLLRIGGPLGGMLGLVLLYYWKKVLPEQESIRKQQREDLERARTEYQQILTSALSDARSERDQERKMREAELSRYMDSLKYRDDRFKEVADAINSVKPRRER